MKIKGHRTVNPNHELTSSVLRLLNDYGVAKCVNDLEPLCKSNHSGFSKWVITEFDGSSDFD